MRVKISSHICQNRTQRFWISERAASDILEVPEVTIFCCWILQHLGSPVFCNSCKLTGQTKNPNWCNKPTTNLRPCWWQRKMDILMLLNSWPLWLDAPPTGQQGQVGGGMAGDLIPRRWLVPFRVYMFLRTVFCMSRRHWKRKTPLYVFTQLFNTQPWHLLLGILVSFVWDITAFRVHATRWVLFFLR